jgi:hypothetical protein
LPVRATPLFGVTVAKFVHSIKNLCKSRPLATAPNAKVMRTRFPLITLAIRWPAWVVNVPIYVLGFAATRVVMAIFLLVWAWLFGPATIGNSVTPP